MHSIKVIAGSMLGLALAMTAPKTADSAPPGKTGLGIGHSAPDWKLSDQNGKKHTLQSLIQKGPVALVFYRSANW